MQAGQAIRILKQDALGRVERIELAASPRSSGAGAALSVALRRVACGGRCPGSRWLARRLLVRERAALAALAGLPGVPALVLDERFAQVPSAGGRAPRARETLVRSWIDGRALHEAEALPVDFFDQLDALVLAVHARGVCHNDLHKEQNILVGRDGFPHLVDFQLASRHSSRSRSFRSRVLDDLRHVEKHRRRYTRFGRGPQGVESRGLGHAVPRTPLARAWRRCVKPLYVFVTRKLFATRDGEARRESSGPWPKWLPAVGARPVAHVESVRATDLEPRVAGPHAERREIGTRSSS